MDRLQRNPGYSGRRVEHLAPRKLALGQFEPDRPAALVPQYFQLHFFARFIGAKYPRGMARVPELASSDLADHVAVFQADFLVVRSADHEQAFFYPEVLAKGGSQFGNLKSLQAPGHVIEREGDERVTLRHMRTILRANAPFVIQFDLHVYVSTAPLKLLASLRAQFSARWPKRTLPFENRPFRNRLWPWFSRNLHLKVVSLSRLNPTVTSLPGSVSAIRDCSFLYDSSLLSPAKRLGVDGSEQVAWPESRLVQPDRPA